MSTGVSSGLQHPLLGRCQFIRVESVDWIVRSESSGALHRVTPDRRTEFEIISSQAESDSPRVDSQIQPHSTVQNDAANLGARRLIESLRSGLTSPSGSPRQLAVGFSEMDASIRSFLSEVDSDGGGAMIMKGAYGQGKTFALTMLEEVALESQFMTVRTEIDATENRLDKPHHVYRDLINHLRTPDNSFVGTESLARKTRERIDQQPLLSQYHREEWLLKELGCPPLAWLFSDRSFFDEEPLLGLFRCDPNTHVSEARKRHTRPANAREWPAFSAGTQGDFASFLLSGIGCLARLLGYKGLIIILDEMEKWNQLNWKEQCRAGNLLGGLIWGATAPEGQRNRGDSPAILKHSARGGGYPFTTTIRNHVGVAIAMTPGECAGPEQLWQAYGPIKVNPLPILTAAEIGRYCTLLSPVFTEAYGLSSPTQEELNGIAANAQEAWRRSGDMSIRSGVQAALTAFDQWRE